MTEGVTSSPGRQLGALAGSLAMHLAVLAAVVVWGRRLPKEQLPARDVWSGRTVVIDALFGEPEAVESGREPAPADRARTTPASAARAPAPPREAPPAPPTAATRRPGGSPAEPSRRAAEPEDDWISLDDQLEPDEAPSAPTEGASPDPNEAVRRKILGYRPPARAERAPAEERASSARSAAPFGGIDAGAPQIRNLSRAFTRAIPAASTRDPAWRRLPLGDAGTVRVTLAVDAAGHLRPPRFHGEPPAHLERLVERTVLALRGGRFALEGGHRSEEELVLRVTLSERRFAEGPLELGFEAPRPGRPGKAYFRLPGGRFVEVRVSLGR